MARILLTLRYDGTAYHGWQVQPNGVTVQQVLQDAVERVTGVRMKAQPELKSLGSTGYTADDCSLVVDNRMVPVKSFDSLWRRDVDGFYVNANVDSSANLTANSIALLRVNTGAAIIASTE